MGFSLRQANLFMCKVWAISYYLAHKFFAAAKRAPWADNRRFCYYLTLYPPSQKTMGLPMDECTKSYGGISPQTMGG